MIRIISFAAFYTPPYEKFSVAIFIMPYRFL